MNRFKNKPNIFDTEHRDLLCRLRKQADTDKLPNPIYGLPDVDNTGESYQDLYDLLADDYRGGYHGERKLKLLLYIQHRAFREYGVIIHTGSSRLDAEDNHFGTPDVLAELCDDYDSYEREEVQEFLAGIR